MMPYYLLFLIIYLSSYYDICKGDSFQIRKKGIAYIIISIGIIFMTLNVNIFSFVLTFCQRAILGQE